MPPKKDKNASTGDSAPVSTREMTLLETCVKTLPASAKTQINWTVVAQEGGYKSEKSARESFRQVCQKRGWFEAAEGAGGDGTATTPVETPSKSRASAKKPAKKPADADAKVDDTPTKKTKVEEEKEDAKAPADANKDE